MAPVRTRFVRIYPERATTEGLGLRLELTGCDVDGEFSSQRSCDLSRGFYVFLLPHPGSQQQNQLFRSVFPNLIPTSSHKTRLAKERRTPEKMRFIYSFINFFGQKKLANTFPPKV